MLVRNVGWVDLGLETRGSAKLQALLTITSTGPVQVKIYNRREVCEKFAHICYKENSRFSSTLCIFCAVRAYVWVCVSSTNTVLPPDATLNAVMPKYVLCLSICDVQVPWSHRLEYLENNFGAEWLSCSHWPNISDLLQGEHAQNYVVIWLWSWAKNLQYLWNGATEDHGYHDELTGSRIRAFDWC